MVITQGANKTLFNGMSEENSSILVLGLIDTVSCVSDYYGKVSASQPEIWRRWRGLVDMEMHSLRKYATEQDIMRVLSYTVVLAFIMVEWFS